MTRKKSKQVYIQGLIASIEGQAKFIGNIAKDNPDMPLMNKYIRELLGLTRNLEQYCNLDLDQAYER